MTTKPCCNLPPIACALGANDFAKRTAWISNLARQHLRAAKRTRLSIQLTYALEASPQVLDLVRQEQACCAFLQFDLREDTDAVRLTITAPERAHAIADELLAYFAPGVASSPYVFSPQEVSK